MGSKLTKKRKTLGRTTTLRFTVKATNSARSRAPCVMSLPTNIGMGSKLPP
jgi:hypothetical protein